MKTRTLSTLLFSAALLMPLAFFPGCARQVSHSESTKQGWFGGQVHETNTAYKNSDGSSSIESETTKTNGGTTTIVRERKTTNTDGTVKTDRETRTIVQGSDNSTSESKTTN